LKSDAFAAIGFLLGHFMMLRDLAAAGQFNVAVDAYIDNHGGALDGNS
jgi:hypothetical protein